MVGREQDLAQDREAGRVGKLGRQVGGLGEADERVEPIEKRRERLAPVVGAGGGVGPVVGGPGFVAVVAADKLQDVGLGKAEVVEQVSERVLPAVRAVVDSVGRDAGECGSAVDVGLAPADERRQLVADAGVGGEVAGGRQGAGETAGARNEASRRG